MAWIFKGQDYKRLPYLDKDELFAKFESSSAGLRSNEAGKRLAYYGRNEFEREKRSGIVEFLSKFKSPMIIILICASVISYYFGHTLDSTIIICLVVISALLDLFQERRASHAAEKLQKRVSNVAMVLRDGKKQEIPVSGIVPGDIVFLSAGDIVPADGIVIETNNFFADQSALTGESYPAEKIPEKPIVQTKDASAWSNYIFMGTSVVTGGATALVVRTGKNTEYGEIIRKTQDKKPKTEFEKGMTKFSLLISKIIILLIIFVFLINATLKNDVLSSFMFAVALAVGMTPQLLPVIVSINLANGAINMSKKNVIVKRLSSIENFGSMDVLCTDKTGTLTENRVDLILHVDIDGKESERVFVHSYLNSCFETGLKSPLDDAIMRYRTVDTSACQKIAELPYDFKRKRSSVAVFHQNYNMLITKGAPEEVIKICAGCEMSGHVERMSREISDTAMETYKKLSSQGYRVLAVAYKSLPTQAKLSLKDESDEILVGFVAFLDPPKPSAKESIADLEKSGIKTKIMTGDNEFVTAKICEKIGLDIDNILMGTVIESMEESEFQDYVEKTNIFVRVTPTQKEMIVQALKKNGHVVGVMGDGINDALPMKAADVSISVDNAVDIAKETADIILVNKDLKVLHDGVIEGRKTFANTMKFIIMGVSSNFGNMISAAGASIFLPFLPMLPIQILLNNLLYDVSQLAIPTDRVDKEYVEKPKRIDTNIIKKFIIFFGPISSLFDYMTFFVMLAYFHSSEPLFQTAWFVESLCTQTLIIFVIRTRISPFYKSRPSLSLILNMLLVVAAAVLIPYTIVAAYFKFVPLPIEFMWFLIAFITAYLIVVEIVKRHIYKTVYVYSRDVVQESEAQRLKKQFMKNFELKEDKEPD